MDGLETPIFDLNVLGGFRLSVAGRPVDLRSRKLAFLLTFLACNAPAPQPREKLATLLWGSVNDDRARHNLRQAVSRLRQILGPGTIRSVGDFVALAEGAFLCDAARLDHLIRGGARGSAAEATALFKGPLLDGLHISEPAWNDWLAAERERLTDAAIGAMVAVGNDHLAAGRPGEALRLGQCAASLNRYREDAHRLALRTLAATGRTSEAMKYFRDLTAFLRNELMAEPDLETRRIAEALRRAPGAAATPAAGTMPARAAPAEPAAPRAAAALVAAPAARPARGSRPLRRRQVTVLACGLVEAAPESPARDPEEADARSAGFRALVAEVAAEFGGAVLASGPGTVQVCFGYPDAHDDDAAQAVLAGLRLARAVAAGAEVPGAGPMLCAGIASGVVVIGQEDAGGAPGPPVVRGEAPGLAARIQALAAPGAVLVSRETRWLLGARFRLTPVEAALPGAPPAWRVGGARDLRARHETPAQGPRPPLFGRQEEIELIQRRWARARQGEGQVVFLSGEAGIGKSRLADALLGGLETGKSARLRYQCSPHHTNRPLHPFITQIEWSGRLSGLRTPAEKLARLGVAVKRVSQEPEGDLALLADLLSLPMTGALAGVAPEQKWRMTVAAFLRWIEQLSARRPVVMLFEDIHWIDTSSLDLLDRIVARIATLPVLIVATMRPEHRPHWIGQPNVSMLHLSRLGRRDSTRLVEAVAKDFPIAAALVDQIVDHTDGVPLFIEALTRHLLESGQAEGAGPERHRHGVRLPMPATLQSSLIARLDRLGPHREVALVAAAIGRVFPHDLLAALLPGGAPLLSAALENMAGAGLISRTGTPPHASYAFTHALVRDAAYGMLLKDQRRQLHSGIADRLLDPDAGFSERGAETLAYHLAEAGRTREAIDHWVAASRSAHARWANREAAAFLDLAIGALDGLPQDAETRARGIDLRFALKNVLITLGEFGRIEARLREARTLIDTTGDRLRLCQFGMHMCQSLGLGGKSGEAIRHGEEALRRVSALDDRRLHVEILLALGRVRFSVMDYVEAERNLAEIPRLLDEAADRTDFERGSVPDAIARAYLARIHGSSGRFDEGRAFGEAAVAQTESVNQPFLESVALWCLADLLVTEGDLEQAIALLERGLALSQKWELPFMVAGHGGLLGYALALLGRVEAGLRLVFKAIDDFESMQHHFGLSLFLFPFGHACVLAGNLDLARDLARRAQRLAAETGHRNSEAGAFYILAEVTLREGALDAARGHYADALGLAEAHGMRPLAARCQDGLAAVHALLGQPGPARACRDRADGLYRQMGMRAWPREVAPVPSA